MGLERFDIYHAQIQMTMVIKMHQLQRISLPALTYKTMESYVETELWKNGVPRNLNQAVDQIMGISVENIVNYLSSQMIHPKKAVRLEDFTDLIGG